MSHCNGDGSDRQSIICNCAIGERLSLIREPSNRYDRNAIKVCRDSGEQLGYINADLASDVAAEMDGGGSYFAVILDLTGGTDDRPTRGVNIAIHAQEAAAQPAPAPRRASDPVLEYARAVQESYIDGYVSPAELTALRTMGQRLNKEQLKAAHALVFANALRTISLDGKFSKADEAMTAGVRKLLETLGWCP